MNYISIVLVKVQKWEILHIPFLTGGLYLAPSGSNAYCVLEPRFQALKIPLKNQPYLVTFEALGRSCWFSVWWRHIVQWIIYPWIGFRPSKTTEKSLKNRKASQITITTPQAGAKFSTGTKIASTKRSDAVHYAYTLSNAPRPTRTALYTPDVSWRGMTSHAMYATCTYTSVATQGRQIHEKYVKYPNFSIFNI